MPVLVIHKTKYTLEIEPTLDGMVQAKTTLTMNEQMILEELLALLKQGAVQIRQDALGGSGGGLCTVQGKRIFFLDTQAPTDFLIQLCAEAVPEVIDIENVYIKPQIRQLIENSTNTRRQQ